MTEYDNTNRGVLFINDRKTEDAHADRNGSINVDGKEYWLNGWLKKDKSGRPFLSLSVKPKEQQQPANKPTAQTRRPAPVPADDGPLCEDDIPF